MALDPEIQAVVNAIDRKISKLQQTKEMLLSEFGHALREEASYTPKLHVRPPAPAPTGLTRKAQVFDFLRQYGPKSRQEIIERLSIPMGTVAYVLNDPKTFSHKGGKWDVRRELKEASQGHQGALTMPE